jgi:hypothetical protein
MNTSSIKRAWWQSPVEAIDPLKAIRMIIECLESGELIPKPAAEHMAKALRQYFQGQTDITRNLGLRVRRGGRHDAPLAIEKKSMRDDFIKKLFDAQSGRNSEKANRAAHLLKNPGLISDKELREGIEKICEQFGHELPTSTRQILRISDIK